MAYEKRVLVDGETPLNKDLLDHIQDGIAAAHDSIGTADISGIGDGTIKGAILALKALIESGGGGSGGDTGDFAIVLKNKDSYESDDYIVGEDTFYLVDPARRVPTMEQMEGCYMVCTIGGETVKFHSPIIEERADETGINYLVRFEKVYAHGDDYGSWYTGYHLCVITTSTEDGGVFVYFNGLIETFNDAIEGSVSDFQGGTLTFQAPQSGDSGGGSDDEDVNLPAAAYSVYVHDENYYGENAVMDYGESAEGRWVDSQVPTLLQMQRCEMRAGFPGEISCKLGDPEVVDYGGNKDHYAIYFRSSPEQDMSLSLDIPHLLVCTTPGAYQVGVYVVFEAFAQTHGAIWEGEASMEYANISFPEVL